MPTVTLLHTNDLHARLDQMARLATLIQRERALARDEGRALLLLDAGDSSAAQSWESDVTGGRANYALLEAMGYDAAAIGNSDSHWGRDALNKLLASVHFAPLAANLLDAATGLRPSGLHTHTLFRRSALAVGVGALTTHNNTHPDFRIGDPVAALRALLPQLQNEGAQIVIVLSHLGIEADRRLAARVPDIHAILGGHTHTRLERPDHVGTTAIVQAGEFGNFLGRLDLSYDDSTRAVTVAGYGLIPCTRYTPPDPTLAGMLDLIRFEAEGLRKKKTD